MDVLDVGGDASARAGGAGTLWSMRCKGSTARCVFAADRDGWQVRVVVDGFELLQQPARETQELFRLAEQWQARMAEVGWVTAPIRLRPGARHP